MLLNECANYLTKLKKVKRYEDDQPKLRKSSCGDSVLTQNWVQTNIVCYERKNSLE